MIFTALSSIIIKNHQLDLHTNSIIQTFCTSLSGPSSYILSPALSLYNICSSYSFRPPFYFLLMSSLISVHYVFLSATIPNAKQFAEWISFLHNQVNWLQIHSILPRLFSIGLPRSLYRYATSSLASLYLSSRCWWSSFSRRWNGIFYYPPFWSGIARLL